MTWSSASSPGHPVVGAAAAVIEAVKGVDDIDPLFMRVAEKQTALVELARARDLVEALWLRVLDASEDVAAETGARDVAAWLHANTRTDRGTAGAAMRLAASLAGPWGVTGDAVRAGQVTVDQATVITRCLDDLHAIGRGDESTGADEVPPVPHEVLARAEAKLVELAAVHTPSELRRLGEKILTTVAPDVAEETERRLLEAAEAKASAATRLTMRRRGDGSTDLSARIPDAVAARLKTYLDAFSAPRTAQGPQWRPGTGMVDPATGIRLPYDRVQGHAFTALLECLPADAMPIHGGTATTVVVTIDLEHLLSGLGEATTLDGSTRITAAEARRLACTAGLVPAVLGTKSEVLDLGRRSRFFNAAQRLKEALEHPTCRTEGCSVPATMCEGHHGRDPWAQGGTTDQDDLILLCPWHHHRAHDPDYLLQRLPNGDVRFHRRR